MTPPRVLYLHGFTSGPGSKKGVAVAERLARRGIEVARLDLRVPSIERLSLAAMMEVTRAAIGGPDDRALLIGSSLGGLTAARVAEGDPRVRALVLMAPAFRFAARWRDLLGDQEWLETHDHATGGVARVHAGFFREAAELDVGWPDVRVPTLILHGRSDEVVPVEVSRVFAAGRADVIVVELDDGHDLLASLPTVLDATERFICDHHISDMR